MVSTRLTARTSSMSLRSKGIPLKASKVAARTARRNNRLNRQKAGKTAENAAEEPTLMPRNEDARVTVIECADSDSEDDVAMTTATAPASPMPSDSEDSDDELPHVPISSSPTAGLPASPVPSDSEDEVIFLGYGSGTADSPIVINLD